ncbi:protoporphyrinogen oxidase [Polystyrenella longa]|uniref:Protoporphyrinogen oxidase n=1 Tax=Polystyrenella longa TaxID=2528007 RepID=A0A518CK62_9PLAN|nr:FAD-dependent oxidoreductase [Polystyrenella longa]QDU79619.1 protoporphyrinogen oxidase [Polystyrenella longa]
MKIAIIGSGISGLVAAYQLHSEHDVTVYEANSYIGGHTNTRTVQHQGHDFHIDTGFIVFNDRTYPNFIKLLDELGVHSQPTSMSFSVRNQKNGLEYNGTSLNGFFAQRRNLFRPQFYRFLREIVRFNREGTELAITDEESDLTVAQFLKEGGYSRFFAEHYLLPMGAAIWSCPPETFANFPMQFIAQFYHHHGLLSLKDRPTWRVIEGGSQEYVKRLTAPFQDRIELNTPVQKVERQADCVRLHFANGQPQEFDEVIFACHSDQALGLLPDADMVERELLHQFPYSRNTAILHTDISVLPRSRRAWANWNYHVREDQTRQATVTYNMNMLQHLDTTKLPDEAVFCVTLNESELIDPDKVLYRAAYSHPIYTTGRLAAQRRHYEVIRRNRTSFCGAYWGNGFHEDGVKSAMAVVEQFQDPDPKSDRGSIPAALSYGSRI